MAEMDPAQLARQQWEDVASAWEAGRDRLFTQVRAVSERLVDLVEPQPGQTVLEVTAGPGETGFLAAERLGPTGHLVSSDFVPAMVEAARRGAEARGLTNVECRVIDATQIDLPAASVDGVLSRFGLMLIPDQQRAMAELRRVLRPGGRLAYATWATPDRNPWLGQIVLALLTHGHALPGNPFEPGGVFSLAAAEANESLVTGAGFEQVRVEEVQGTMRFDSVEDYFFFNTSVAGPVAKLVEGFDRPHLDAVLATVTENVQGFARDGGLELPWTAVLTAAS